MELNDIRFIKAKQGTGMTLLALDLTRRLAESKNIKSVQVFKSGTFKFYNKEEFLKDCSKALGGEGVMLKHIWYWLNATFGRRIYFKNKDNVAMIKEGYNPPEELFEHLKKYHPDVYANLGGKG